jgi:hypothetical protein
MCFKLSKAGSYTVIVSISVTVVVVVEVEVVIGVAAVIVPGLMSQHEQALLYAEVPGH